MQRQKQPDLNLTWETEELFFIQGKMKRPIKPDKEERIHSLWLIYTFYENLWFNKTTTSATNTKWFKKKQIPQNNSKNISY